MYRPVGSTRREHAQALLRRAGYPDGNEREAAPVEKHKPTVGPQSVIRGRQGFAGGGSVGQHVRSASPQPREGDATNDSRVRLGPKRDKASSEEVEEFGANLDRRLTKSKLGLDDALNNLGLQGEEYRRGGKAKRRADGGAAKLTFTKPTDEMGAKVDAALKSQRQAKLKQQQKDFNDQPENPRARDPGERAVDPASTRDFDDDMKTFQRDSSTESEARRGGRIRRRKK